MMSDALSPQPMTPNAAPVQAGPVAGARIIAITSGKGGVGTTFVSANLAAVHLAVADGGARNRKAVQEGFAAFLGIALKPAARRVRRRKVFGQKSACGFHLVVRYTHQQVVEARRDI